MTYSPRTIDNPPYHWYIVLWTFSSLWNHAVHIILKPAFAPFNLARLSPGQLMFSCAAILKDIDQRNKRINLPKNHLFLHNFLRYKQRRQEHVCN